MNARKIFSVVLVTLALAFLAATPAFALSSALSAVSHGAQIEAPATDAFGSLFAQYLALAGVGSFVAMLVSAAKFVTPLTQGRVVLIPDGYSDSAQAMINVLLFVIFVFTKALKPAFDFSYLDAQAQHLANYAVQLIGLLVQIGSATFAYQNVLRGKFLIGTSFSPKAK